MGEPSPDEQRSDYDRPFYIFWLQIRFRARLEGPRRRIPRRVLAFVTAVGVVDVDADRDMPGISAVPQGSNLPLIVLR